MNVLGIKFDPEEFQVLSREFPTGQGSPFEDIWGRDAVLDLAHLEREHPEKHWFFMLLIAFMLEEEKQPWHDTDRFIALRMLLEQHYWTYRIRRTRTVSVKRRFDASSRGWFVPGDWWDRL